MMNPRTNSITNLYNILAISTLVAFTSCGISSYASNIAPPNIYQSQTPQNHPPLCTYPPPSTALAPPTLLPTPPPSPPSSKPDHAAWCVAKKTVAASATQTALDYACASGADCGPIQVGGACFEPDTVVAHASFAFNSYWQKNKLGGGTCDFGGSATLVTLDPSYGECHFLVT